MKTFSFVVVVVAAMCAACGVYVEMRQGGASRQVEYHDIGTTRNEIVLEQARADLQCENVTVTPEPSPMLFPDGPLLAGGCGRQERYEQVVCKDSFRYIPIRRPELDAARYAGPGCTGDAIVALARYRTLTAAGARDLACSRDQVEVRFVSTAHSVTPVAEGCGKRATYLPSPTGEVGDKSLASVVAVP